MRQECASSFHQCTRYLNKTYNITVSIMTSLLMAGSSLWFCLDSAIQSVISSLPSQSQETSSSFSQGMFVGLSSQFFVPPASWHPAGLIQADLAWSFIFLTEHHAVQHVKRGGSLAINQRGCLLSVDTRTCGIFPQMTGLAWFQTCPLSLCWLPLSLAVLYIHGSYLWDEKNCVNLSSSHGLPLRVSFSFFLSSLYIFSVWY